MTAISRSALVLALASVLGLSGIASASAATWAEKHPRRVEVNHRLANQDRRVDRDLAEGKVTARQAARLHHEDHMVRTSERFDARFGRSHLTRAEQRSLNQDENGISRQIHRDAH
ncbi:MAG TPA: hypothetical protein VKB67_08735 [Rhizomicrobium sp.]|nr:hypothetical protein [Rhizomicrobium sp.]